MSGAYRTLKDGGVGAFTALGLGLVPSHKRGTDFDPWPVYSNARAHDAVGRAMVRILGTDYDRVIAVREDGVPLATNYAYKTQKPLAFARRLDDGPIYSVLPIPPIRPNVSLVGQRCLVITDLISSGPGVMKAIDAAQSVRQAGGHPITLFAPVFDGRYLLDGHGKPDEQMQLLTKEFRDIKTLTSLEALIGSSAA